MGIKYASKDNLARRDAQLAMIQLKPTSWEKIDGQPDHLLTAFKKAQVAVNIMDSDPDFKPTRRTTIQGVLATYLATQGIRAKGCGNCPLHCSILKNGTYFFCNAPFSEDNCTHEPGNRVHLAVTDAHDDDSDTPDPAMLAINRFLNDDLVDNDLHREIAAACTPLLKCTSSLALKLSPLAVIKTSTTAPNACTRSSPLASLVPATFHFLKTILKCNVARVICRPPRLISFFVHFHGPTFWSCYSSCYFECYGICHFLEGDTQSSASMTTVIFPRTLF